MNYTYVLSNTSIREIIDLLTEYILRPPELGKLNFRTHRQVGMLQAAIDEGVSIRLFDAFAPRIKFVQERQVLLLDSFIDVSTGRLTPRALEFIEDFLAENVELPEWM